MLRVASFLPSFIGLCTYSFPHSFMLPTNTFALLGPLCGGLSSECIIVLAFRELWWGTYGLYPGKLLDYLLNLDLQTAVPILAIRILVEFIMCLCYASARSWLGKTIEAIDRFQFESCLHHKLAMWSWEGHLFSLIHNFPTSKGNRNKCGKLYI